MVESNTEKIQITISKKVSLFLDKLIETEMYGKSRAEVIERLILIEMEYFLTTDKIEKLNPKW